MTALRHRVRRAIDRVVDPYVERIVGAVGTSAAAPPAPTPEPAPEPAPDPLTTSDRFHQLNHELRTIALEEAPKGAARVVSIGASGRWYFDWFEASVGPVQEHVGVEAYLPEPDDLPPYARWIAATADQLDEIESGSVDLVYAGQTSEHLWPRELIGFLLGSHRILHDGGWLVLDSPNRSVTEHLRWSHGGHTIELSIAEIGELLELAGFEPVVEKGLWRCRMGGRVLQLEEGLDDPALTLRRSLPCPPDDAFLWWVEARRRAGAAPSVDRLTARVEELFARHWPVRTCRGMWDGPEPRDVPLAAHGTLASLPFPLYDGVWGLSLEVRGEPAALVDAVVVAPGGQVFADLRGEDADRGEAGRLTWTFTMPYYVEALSLQVTSRSSDVAVAMPASLVPEVGR
jgi:hypothetical protein